MLVALAAGFTAGVSSQVLWPALPAAGMALAGAVFALVLAWCASGAWRQVALIAAATGVGILWAGACASAVLAARLPHALEGRDLVIEGSVRALRYRADGSVAFQLVVDAVPWLAGDETGSATWQVRLASRADAPLMRAGERWRLAVRLNRPRSSQNPGVADFERYLLGERVIATGFLKAAGAHVRLAPASGWDDWRNRLLDHATPLFGAGPGDIARDEADRFARAVLPALVVDERSLLTAAHWRVLGSTGTAHLVAISGLHVSLLWGAVLWMAARLLRRRPGSLRYRAAAVLPALLLAAAYAALAGMPLPAARATLMLAAASLFLLCSGTVPAWRVLLASTALVLAIDPLSAHATGYWLSFGAVGVLLMLNDLRWQGPIGATRIPLLGDALAGIRMQVFLSILLAPMLIALFGSASVSSVLANLPAIPMVNLLALPPALAGVLLAPLCPWLANPCIDLATLTLSVLWDLLVWVDGIAILAPVRAHGASAAGVVALSGALVIACVARSWLLRATALPIMFLAWPAAPQLPSGVADVCILDVGQGLAVTVRTARHGLLYDAGPAWGEDADAGSLIVVPAARALGIRQLDMFVVSHDDADHAGGTLSVATALNPRDVVVGDTDTLASNGLRGRRCDAATAWRWDGVRFLLLPGDPAGRSNDRSCVLHVSAGGTGVLLPGDIGRRRELSLAAAWGARLSADVLVAGHHGSRTSTGPTFLYRVGPTRVVFSAGYRNRFGHPDEEVTGLLRRAGVRMHGTAEEGAVCLRLQGSTPLAVTTARGSVRRFWQE